MSEHVRTGAAAENILRRLASLTSWHDRRPRAHLPGLRGWIWAALVGVVFFWMSNPLVFVPGFHLALPLAVRWTLLVLLLTLPWLRLPRIPWPWLAFLGLCWVSAQWSIYPAVTYSATWVYAQITLIALAAAANCSARVVAWGLASGGTMVMALSLYAFREGMWGAAFISVDGPVLTGVGTNQNILAYTVAISLAATLSLAIPETLWARIAFFCLLAVQYYAIYRAGSGTGYLTALGVTVAAVALWATAYLHGRGRRGTYARISAVALTMVAGLTGILALLGDQVSTLSGRVPFWTAILEVSRDRPLLGAGWGAVWIHPWNNLAPPNAVLDDIVEAADGYVLSHGHNLLLDVLPELGAVGVAMVLLMVAYAIWTVARCGTSHGPSGTAGRQIVLVLVAIGLFGLTEPMLTAPVGWWSLALVVAVARQRELPPRYDRPRGAKRRSMSDADLSHSSSSVES